MLKSKSNFSTETVTVQLSIPERNLELFHDLIKHIQSLVAVSRFLQVSVFDKSINNEQDEECEYFFKSNHIKFYLYSLELPFTNDLTGL